jgi:nitroreductase
MDAIFKRRSVRRFTAEEVPEGLLKKILAAGMAAPSAGNEQPWFFIVVKDKKSLKKLSESSPHARPAENATVAILVCGDLSLERHKGYWVQDCSAAVENMLIETASLGLGAVWLGIYPMQERVIFLQKYFSLDPNIVPFAVIPVGYPEQEPAPQERYNESRIHYERW